MIIDGALSECMTELLLIKSIFLKVKMLLFTFCPSLPFENTLSV